MADNKLVGDFRADALVLSGSEQPNLELHRLVSEPFNSKFGDFELHAQKIVVEGVCASMAAGKRAISASAASLFGLELTLLDRRAPDSGPFARLCLDKVELPRGFQFAEDSVLRVPEIVASDISVATEDIVRLPEAIRAGLPATAAGAQNPDSSASGTRAGSGTPFDFTFLDAIGGHLNVDLFLDVTIPVLGGWCETHEFRIPIRGGTFDFARFEGDINWLTRSVLDIEVKDRKLILEKDLPLIPFDNKVLLAWPLDADELNLARRNRTRLRTLLTWEIPPGQPGDDGKGSAIDLNQIATRNIDIALGMKPSQIDLGDSGRIRLGHGDEPAVEQLTVRGDLEYATDKTLPDTTLRGTAQGLRAGLDALSTGASTVSAQRIDVDTIDYVTVSFTGFLPHRLTGSIDRIAITDLLVDTGRG